MSEKSVILHEEITSPQADAVSVVGSARTRFGISINLRVPQEKISCGDGRWVSGSPGEVLEKLVVGDHCETDENAGNKQTSKVRVSMLFLVLPRWQSPGLSCRASFSQRFSRKKTGGTEFVWVCFWHRSTSAMWVFKSSYLISFWFAGIIWCTHIFLKLVIGAHLLMKMTSWGYCVLVYNCSGEPIVRPGFSGTSRIDSVLIRVWSCCSHFGGGCPERGF